MFLSLPNPINWITKLILVTVSVVVVLRNRVGKYKELDSGISFFALAVNLAWMLNLDYKWLTPLFFGDPMAALVGSHLGRRQNFGATILGSFAFVISSTLTNYLILKDLGMMSHLSISCVSAFIEYHSGKLDNIALAVSGYLFSLTSFKTIPRVIVALTLQIVIAALFRDINTQIFVQKNKPPFDRVPQTPFFE